MSASAEDLDVQPTPVQPERAAPAEAERATASAGAADLQAQAAPAQPERATHVRIDSSFSGTSRSYFFGSLSATFAPLSTLNESGIRFQLQGAIGSYAGIANTALRVESFTDITFRPPNITIKDREEQGAALIGYGWVFKNLGFPDGLSITAYVGADVQHHKPSSDDLVNTGRATVWGVRTALDLYANPTENTMLSALGSYSTAYNEYYAQVKTGYAFIKGVFVGPEAIFLGNSFLSHVSASAGSTDTHAASLQQWRVGGHVTGFKLGYLELGLSGGYLKDRAQGSGGYGTLSVGIEF